MRGLVGVEVYLVIQGPLDTRSYPCREARMDVVEHFARATPPMEVSLRCGYRHRVSVAELFGGVRLGFETCGVVVWVSRLKAAIQEVD